MLFFIFRVYVRVKSFGRVYADDYLVMMGWIALFGCAITWQVQLGTFYTLESLSKQYGMTISLNPVAAAAGQDIQKTYVTLAILLLVSLYSIKLSFLIFFRRLGQNVKGHKTWWRIVLGSVAIAFLTSIGIGALQYRCYLAIGKTTGYSAQHTT